MKILWITVAVILSFGFNIQALNSFPDIKIFYDLYDSGKWHIDKYPVLELKATGMNLYEVEKEDETQDALYVIKLDGDGKPIKVLDSDLEYMDKFYTALGDRPMIIMKGNKAPEALTIGAINKSFKRDNKIVCMAFSLKKDSSNNLTGVFGYIDGFVESQYFQTGTITLIDSDYNYFRLQHTDKGLVFQNAYTLNPDLINSHDYIGSFKMVTWISDEPIYRNFKPANKDKKGFIWMKIGSKETYVAGDEEEIKHPPEYKNGVVCASLNELTKNTLSRLETRDNKTFSIYRITNMTGVPASLKTKNVKLTVGDFVYYVNDKKYLFPVAPYFRGDELFVPLMEMCDAINAEYHFREMDETILIGRFDKSIEK